MRKIYLVLCFLFNILAGYSQPTNIDFNGGNINGWTFEEAQNLNSYLMTNGTYSLSSKYALMMPGVLEVNNVPITMVSPLGGKFMRVGNISSGGRSYKLSQTFNVSTSSQALSVSYALVSRLENNYCNDKPYFNFVLKDNSGNIIPSTQSHHTPPGAIFPSLKCSNGDPSFTYINGFNYKNWITKNFSLQDYVGTSVTIEFIASGSTDSISTHPLYAYVDASICSNSFLPNILSVNTNTYNLLQSQNSLLVCGTTSASIVAPGSASSYSWTGTGIAGSTSQSVTISQPGKYQLIFDNPSACSIATSVSFTVSASPTLSINSASNTACSGSAFTMTVSGAKNYTWTPFFNDSTGINTNFASQRIVYPYSSASSYTVFGADSSGCVSVSQFSLTVLPRPTLSVSGNTSICIGANASLTATGANSYTWTPPGNIYSSTISVSPSYNLTYSVTGTDTGTGCSATSTVSVVVDRNIEDNYLNSTICIGDSIIRTAIGATSYTWSNGVTTNSVVLSPTVTTVYTLSATSSCGITQKAFTVTVNALPSVVANATQTFVCNGTAIKLFGSGASFYSWSNGVVNNVLFTPTVTNTYSVLGTSSNGCKKSATITLSVVPVPTITVSGINILCLGQTSTLTASGANTYTWVSGVNTTSISVNSSNSGTYNYNVTGKNSLGCPSTVVYPITVYSATPTFSFASSIATVCAVNSNTIGIPFPGTYPYDIYTCGQPNTTCSINGLVLNPSPMFPTTYSVTATNGCGTITRTIQVIPQSLPSLSLTTPDSVCVGASFNYSITGADLYLNYGIGGGYTSVNTFTGTAPTNTASLLFVGISGKYFNSCQADTGRYVKIISRPVLSIVGNSTLTCTSCTTNLIASGALSYAWNTGVSTASLSVAPPTTTTYTVTGTTFNGCSSSAKSTIVVLDSLTMCFNSQFRIPGSNLKDIVAEDFNGDGKTDIVASNSTNTGLSIYINNGNGVFVSPVNFGSNVSNYGLSSGDVNNDGALDIIVPRNTLYPDVICVYINDGQGNFIGPNSYTQGIGGFSPLNIFSVEVADLTGDGFDEIITGNVNGIVIYTNSGSGTFINQTKYYFSGMMRSISTADLNNDNKLDIIARSENDSAFVFLNNGSGGFLPYQKYSSGRRGVICDMNLDGNPDIISALPNKLSVLINNGSGVFTSSINQTFDMLYPWDVSSSDFNNDGYEDLAITNYSSINSYEYIQVLMNNKDNTFHSPVNYYPSHIAPYLGLNVLTKDMNQDSRPDLAIINGSRDSILILLNAISPTLTITPQTNSVVCAGVSLALTATGANTYTWSGGISNGVVFNPTQTETYYVSASDASGCSGYAVTTVSISPNISVFTASANICNGLSATVIANGADTYSWSTGANTASISVSPTVSTVYSVTGSDIGTGCIYTKTLSLTVDSCSDVWPGDANSDGTADNLDVLELGLHYTQTGAPRASISNNWQPYFSNSWTGIITNGKNLNHSDCNGDGIINDNDTLAIYNNYGLTHAFKTAQTTTVNPQLSIVPDQAMVVKGMWGTASVYLGDVSTPIININGVAFTVDFDNTLIEPNSIYLEYQNSFLDASQNLHFRKPDFSNAKIFTANTHTVSNNVSGYGKIATLHYQILSSLATDQTLTLGVSQANQSDASGTIVPLTSGTGTVMAIGASVGVMESLMSNNILISPNPTNGLLNIGFVSIPQNTNIEMYNSIGALVLLETMSNKMNTINTAGLSSGIYFMKVIESNKVVAVKKVVKE